MAKWFAKFGSHLKTNRGPAGPRDLGDAARDAQNWNAAAAAYEAHLGGFPDDVAIWIQLGHVRKEAGRYDSALEAYQRAQTIHPSDADLLLSFGHLHKVMGNLPLAESFYAASAQIDNNAEARREYARIAVIRPLDQETKEALVVKGADAIEYLETHCTGLKPTVTSDVVVFTGGKFSGTSIDPWIELSIDSGISDTVRLAELVIDIDSIDQADTLDSKLYFDYGEGFSEYRSIEFRAAPGKNSVFLACPSLITRLRWDPDTGPSTFHLKNIAFLPAASVEDAHAALSSSGLSETWHEAATRAASRAYEESSSTTNLADRFQIQLKANFHLGLDYEFWRSKFIDPAPEDYETMATMVAAMHHLPKFSFILPTYNTDPDLLVECIDSMLAQNYPNFEICIADDNSPNPEVAEVLRRYEAQDARISVCFRRANGHISANTNSALALATGDFVVLVDHDDTIPDYALFVLAHYINKNPDAQVIFSDEDKLSMEGRQMEPYFKSDFNLYLMYGHNMVSHLGVYKRALVEKVGGFRMGLEGSQDYDLTLRCYEVVGDKGFLHVPHVLYHWRAIPGSTAVSADQKGYAVIAAEMAINGHFDRTGAPLRSVNGIAPGLTAIKPTREFDTLVTIVIPTRDGIDVLKPCIESILARAMGNLEILIVDNGSTGAPTLEYFDELTRAGTARVLRYDHQFNFSSINNFGVDHARGDIICFLNDDTEVLSLDWLNRARALLSMPDVGMVGARLLFPDRHVQHFGISVGVGTHLVAGTPHSGLPSNAYGYFGKGRLIQEFSAVTAACMFVRKSDFLRLNGFDPVLRVAYNDVDLSLKFRTDGLRIVCDPEILLTHKESRSRGSDMSGANRARLDAEALIMRERWAAVLDADPYISPNHSIANTEFVLAYPPRVPMPWKVADK